MRILALDLATRTGFATWDGARRESGFVDFDVKRGESPGMRFVRFNRWLDDVAGRLGVDQRPRVLPFDIVFYEQPFVMRSGAAAEVSLGFATRVQEFCARYGIEHQPVNGSKLKKWTTGRGNAKKPDMVAAVCQRFFPKAWEEGAKRFEIDDNEADAIALLEYAKAELVPAGSAH